MYYQKFDQIECPNLIRLSGAFAPYRIELFRSFVMSETPFTLIRLYAFLLSFEVTMLSVVCSAIERKFSTRYSISIQCITILNDLCVLILRFFRRIKFLIGGDICDTGLPRHSKFSKFASSDPEIKPNGQIRYHPSPIPEPAGHNILHTFPEMIRREPPHHSARRIRP